MPHEYIPLATSPTSTTGSSESEQSLEAAAGGQRRQRWRSRILVAFATALFGVLAFATYIGTGTTAVLAPADNPYFHTGAIWDHNDAVAARLDRCASLGLLRNTSSPQRVPANESLYAEHGCGLNETTIVILTSLWFAEAFSGTSTAGESIYAQSVISSLNANGYAYVFASLGWWNHDMRKTVELWHRHRGNVRTVLADPEQVNVCWDKNLREEQKCLKDEVNPDGIEAWRLLSFWYWDDANNPLGMQFTLSPSPRNDNYFLSYSIEPTCRRIPVMPRKRQAYLLAKQIHYLDNVPEFSWSLDAFRVMQDELDVKVVGGMVDDNETTSAAVRAAGITNFGKLGKIDFYERLGESFVLIGVGRPRISPSPWDALCMGVPYINPILSWDEEDPMERSKWHAQQWHMTDLEPPFVYHVHAHNLTELSATVREALDNPIQSFIPHYMRFDFVAHKMAALLNDDWRGRAATVLAEREASGGDVSHLWQLSMVGQRY